MPWGEKTVEKQREEFVKEVLTGEKSKSAVCREYGISRVTGDKWLKRQALGEGMTDRSKAPFRIPNRTKPEKEKAVLEVREKHPAWGPRKIRRYLERHGEQEMPSRSTIGNILTRNGCISEAASKASKPCKRFQRESSNELWQCDFKGDFGMLDGNRCHALTVMDDYSRYSLCVDAKDNEKREGVTESFTRLFKTNGLPESLLCDNGNPWGTSQSTGYTQFEIWLMDYGILPIHGRVRHPQTQGKEERFHRTMDVELLNLVEIQNLKDAQKQFDQFRECYNNERPHEALELGVPSEYYRHSNRSMPEQVRAWEYPSGFVLRQIKKTGYFTFGSQGYFLSESFGGLTVGVRESAIENCINLYYRGFKIARIDLRERAFLSKKIWRVDEGSASGEN